MADGKKGFASVDEKASQRDASREDGEAVQSDRSAE